MNKQALEGMTARKLEAGITQGMLEAGINVFAAMALTETIRPVVEEYQKAILKDMQALGSKRISERARNDKERVDEIILNPENTYLMEDADFQIYIDRCHDEHIKHGFEVKERGYCPLLVAEHQTIEMKWVLIDAFYPLTGLELSDLSGYKSFDQYIELLLKMVASHN